MEICDPYSFSDSLGQGQEIWSLNFKSIHTTNKTKIIPLTEFVQRPFLPLQQVHTDVRSQQVCTSGCKEHFVQEPPNCLVSI